MQGKSPRVGVVYDCDGTLIDSMGVWRALEDELAAQGGFALTKADTDHITTLTIPECGDFFHEKFGLGASGAAVKGMIDEFMMDFYANRAQERPGALAFVRALAERGVPQSVASSTPAPLLRAGLAHAGFAPYLADIVSVDDVGASKREPAVYDRAREPLGTTRAQTWGLRGRAVRRAHPVRGRLRHRGRLRQRSGLAPMTTWRPRPTWSSVGFSQLNS